MQSHKDFLKAELYNPGKEVKTFYFDSEHMNPRINNPLSYTNVDGTNKGIGLGFAMQDQIFYTVVDPFTTSETQFNIEFDKKLTPGSNIDLKIGNQKLTLDQQQIAELGFLFLALSGRQYDHDSAWELIDGYGNDYLKHELQKSCSLFQI